MLSLQNKTVANRDALKQMTKCLALYEVMNPQRCRRKHMLFAKTKINHLNDFSVPIHNHAA